MDGEPATLAFFLDLFAATYSLIKVADDDPDQLEIGVQSRGICPVSHCTTWSNHHHRLIGHRPSSFPLGCRFRQDQRF